MTVQEIYTRKSEQLLSRQSIDRSIPKPDDRDASLQHGSFVSLSMPISPAYPPQLEPVPLRPAEHVRRVSPFPRPLTPLIGREREVDSIVSLLLRDEVRLLT